MTTTGPARRRPNPRLPTRPRLEFIAASTDESKIRFFGTLMPALLLLRQAPAELPASWVRRHLTPRASAAELIAAGADDAAWSGDVAVLIHRWEQTRFDARAFSGAKTFLARLVRRLRADGFAAEAFDPLSPRVNLPRLAEAAGLGNLSPFGLLVHPRFGPRLIITAVRTDAPLQLEPRYGGGGCEDCMSCVLLCPQKPETTGVVNLGLCRACAKCLEVCPTGKGRLARERRPSGP